MCEVAHDIVFIILCHGQYMQHIDYERGVITLLCSWDIIPGKVDQHHWSTPINKSRTCCLQVPISCAASQQEG